MLINRFQKYMKLVLKQTAKWQICSICDQRDIAHTWRNGFFDRYLR